MKNHLQGHLSHSESKSSHEQKDKQLFQQKSKEHKNHFSFLSEYHKANSPYSWTKTHHREAGTRKYRKIIAFTFFSFVPHDPFQIHTGPRFTGPETLGLRHYSNVTGIDPHGTSPHQKLFGRGCNVGCSRGKVGGQNLRRETAGNRRWRRWHCKQGVNLKDRQAYCSGAACCEFFSMQSVYIPSRIHHPSKFHLQLKYALSVLMVPKHKAE